MATKKATKSATSDFLSIPMVQDKITKGTLRFHAQSKEGELSIPTLYIKKEAFEKIQRFPRQIIVKVEVVDDES